MPDKIRSLNEAGIREFEKFIEHGAVGGIPYDLLVDDETSYALDWDLEAEKLVFTDCAEFGKYLNTVMKDCDSRKISYDSGLWAWLALYYFDQLCPADASGKRAPYKAYYYVLKAENFRHYYRHMVRAPFILTRDHGVRARILLSKPLNIHGELSEQIASRQDIVGCKPIMALIDGLYYDDTHSKPKTGVTTRGKPGVILRLVDILKQFASTYDLHSMSGKQINDMLPSEFNRWHAA